MKILITGANGFLGQHLTFFLSSKEYDVVAAGRGACRIPQRDIFEYYPVELTDENAVAAMLSSVKPDIIIHTAAMSSPDECENNKAACLKNNVEATNYLLHSFKPSETSSAKFIYISTDFIFGENGPHSEEDKTGPLNFYGESKLMAEQSVITSGLPYAIIRPVFIYGPVWDGLRPSFLHWVKNNLEQHKRIRVVSDQQRTPTYVPDICNGIETIIRKKMKGIYHLAGKDIISPFGMALATAGVLGFDAALIENVTSETFYEPVKRAKYSGLKIDKAAKELDYHPVSIEEGIKLTFNLM